MKFALIAPIFDLDLVEQFDTHLLLAWSCSNEIYKKFYQNLYKRKPNNLIILDNGANEKKIINPNIFFDHVLEMNAKEVQAPDIQFDFQETMKRVKFFFKNGYQKIKDTNIQVMGVPQGLTFKDFKHCWDWMIKSPKINTIGLGYRNVLAAVQDEINHYGVADWVDMGIYDAKFLQEFCEPETFKYTVSRLYFLKRKVNLLDLAKQNKQLHLLGLWNPAELQYYKKVFSKEEQAVIRSCDSAAPIQAAQVYVKFDSNWGVRNKPKEYVDMQTPLGKKQRQIAEENLEILKTWL